MAQPLTNSLLYGPAMKFPDINAGSVVTSSDAAALKQVPLGEAVKESSAVEQGTAARMEANRDEAGVLASAGAAMTQWSAAHVWEALNATKFPPAAPGTFDVLAAMKGIPYPLTLDEEHFFQKTRSPEEFAYKFDEFNKRKDAERVMGDSTAGTLLGTFTDPAFLAISAASGGMGSLARVAGFAAKGQKLVAGATGFGMGVGMGKIEQEVTPLSEGHLYANAMMLGAAEGMLFKGGALVKADPEFPAAALRAEAQSVEDSLRPQPVSASHPEFVGDVRGHLDPAIKPVGKAVTTVERVEDIAMHEPTVGHIDPAAKAVYLPGEDHVFLVKANITAADDVKGLLLHEVGVHMNAERVLGTAKFGEMLNGLERLAAQGNKRAKAAFEAVPKDTPLHLLREEALGHYVEQNHAILKDTFISRLVAGAREKLRTIGLGDLKLTENDIVQLVRKAAKNKGDAPFTAAAPYMWRAGADDVGHVLTSAKPEGEYAQRVKVQGGDHQFINASSNVQSATVRAALDSLEIPHTVNGVNAHALVAEKLGGKMQASLYLHERGVLGIRDAKATRVFNESSIDNAVRYSRPSKSAEVVGKALEWSLNKTFSAFSKEAAEAADLLMDNPAKLSGNSVASQHRAILADFQAHQTVFENTVLEHMAEAGFGTRKQIMQSTEAIAAQNVIERKLADELSRQNRLSHDGKAITFAGVDPKIKLMADQYNAITKAAFEEMQRSGVAGADTIQYHPGYYPRRWDNVSIEGIKSKLIEGGMSEKAAQQTMEDSVSISIQRATGMDAEVAQDVAKATLDRARRKGYFEDTAFRSSMGEETTAEVRDILLSSGISNQRVERALEVMMGANDEAGKASMLKHRVDMALDEPIGNSGHTIGDMIDTRLVHLTDGYLHRTAATAAFARKGLTNASDVLKLRKKVLESIPEQGKRAEAAKLFDGTVATLRGDPVGEDVNKAMRISRGLTQMMGLKMAGLFQFTEFSTLMARHGMLATVGNMVKEAPGLGALLGDRVEATHLREVLVRNCTEDMRMRPFVSRMEDNFTIESGERAQLSIMQAKQLVPYLNGLKYVQRYQARIAGNLMVKTLERAAVGDVKALAVMEGYGLESHIMGAIRGDIQQFGMDTAKWSDATWDAVRGPINKMLDDHVLRSRVGELPAFAQFSTLGKFLFTFRSFVLGAHNKVLAGTLQRNGYAGLSLMLAYQLPLTYLLTQADNAAMGKPPMDTTKAIGATLSQAGSMGLLSELVGVALGNKQQFGSPGTIAIDRGYKLGTAVAGSVRNAAQGKDAHLGNVGAAAFNAVPLLSVITPLKVIPEMLRDKNTHK